MYYVSRNAILSTAGAIECGTPYVRRKGGWATLGRFKETPYLSLLLSSGISTGIICLTTSRAQFPQEQGTYAAARLKQFLRNLQPFQFFGWIALHCC